MLNTDFIPAMTHAAIQPDAESLTAPRARRGSLWLATATLWQREMVRFFRQRNRVVSAVAMPLIFWLFLGSGLNRSFSTPAQNPAVPVTTNDGVAAVSAAQAPSTQAGYLQYFFPGTVVLMLLNTAVFSTISVIEDRREGFLQGVLVAPVPRLGIVLGKVFGGATIATIQGLFFLLLWPLVAGAVSWPWLLAALGVMFLLALGLTALGLCIAWPMDSTAGFHAVMMIFLMPMWLLSGAVFPVGGAKSWLRIVMRCNPLTYGQAAFAQTLHDGRIDPGDPANLTNSLLLTLVFVAVVILLAAALVSRPRKDGTL